MTVGINSNLCKTVVLADPSESIYVTGVLTTSATTRVKILEHTVSAGKDFYIFAYSVSRQSGASTGLMPVTLEIEHASGPNTIADSASWMDGSNDVFPDWSEKRETGFQIAIAGEKVQLWITPTRAKSTDWFAKIVGVER